MTLTLRRDGFVVTAEGAAEAEPGALRAALDGLTEGYATRAVVLVLDGGGRGGGDDAEWVERWFPVPVVAALEGEVAGGAAALALAADIRVAGGDAWLELPEPGSARAAAIQRGAHGRISAGEAFARGIVSALTGPGEAVAEAARLAAVIAGRGPIATRLGKEAVWRGLPQPLEQALRFETDLTLLLQTTKDRAEGVRAFLEKRAPVFTGE
jgi:enoyl-CoA hydratase/carnithine racemase